MILVEVPDGLEARLRDAAAELGLSVAEYARRLLETAAPPPLPRSGAQLLDLWRAEGLIGSRSDVDDSAEVARRIREQAEHREREQ